MSTESLRTRLERLTTAYDGNDEEGFREAEFWGYIVTDARLALKVIEAAKATAFDSEVPLTASIGALYSAIDAFEKLP